MMSYIDSVCNIDENIIERTKPSVKAVLVTWLSVPIAIITLFLTVTLPPIIEIYRNAEKAVSVMEMLGVTELSLNDILQWVWNEAVSWIPTFVIVFLIILFSLLVLAWVIFSLGATISFWGNELAFTDSRVIGKAKDTTLDAALNDINNIFLSQSIWGKLFGYGNLTLQTTKGSLSVKNIIQPQIFKKKLEWQMGK
jgi:hypothetical protein